MITGDNITDAEIRELRRLVVSDPAIGSAETDKVCMWCARALDDGKLPFRVIREARAVCAEVLTARKKEKR